MFEEKERVIQEYVPGKQVTMAHLIANPERNLVSKLGMDPDVVSAIGIMTITPSEASIVAADVATKASGVEIGFLDRFTGCLVVTGDVSSVESALNAAIDLLSNMLKFSTAEITRS
ncbi:ethanolamine utilization microcompartment protein EutS [Parendozoicomonas haliclonae]|uniref:Propanediol utilization protein PduU n=1 Tax=Parendozoicomonas haliclonae TaxID=1960125 RepID=A0A1X7ANY3_9GAMM|nr:BMC domain-containing protein [Parendozoicomonas haliclonae]SMA48789.1 Propanediol utilization protein PduU [Parendozoicomonas haliclonae]